MLGGASKRLLGQEHYMVAADGHGKPRTSVTSKKFDFDHPNTWPRWIKRFERYRVASGLSDRDNPVQISTLIYVMGAEAEDILASFGLNESDRELQHHSRAIHQVLH